MLKIMVYLKKKKHVKLFIHLLQNTKLQNYTKYGYDITRE